MMWGGMHDWGGWGWGIGMIHGLLWLVFIILGIVVLVRYIGRDSAGRPASPGEPAGETALDVLKKRYARGEIDKAEFDEKKRDLS